MFLQHGTDKEEAVQAWKNRALKPSSFDLSGSDDYTEDGDIVESETQKEFRAKGLDEDRIVYLSTGRHFYGQFAEIEIDVDDEYVVQISDDEYVMSVDAPYIITEIRYNGKDYHIEASKRSNGGTW